MARNGKPRLDPPLLLLSRTQAGLLSRAQLRSLGCDDKVVRRQVDGARWQPIGPVVIALFTGPLPPTSRRWAALLNAGPGAALSSWTALEHHGLKGWEVDREHVIVRRGSTVPTLAGVKVHESRRHEERDVVVRAGMRTHTVERAAVDVAAWCQGDRSAGGVLAAVVQQRLTTPQRVLDVLDGQGRIQRRSLMRAILADIAGGSEAMSEIDLVRLCRRRGLPAPFRQSIRTDRDGKRRYLDAEFHLSDGCVRLVEVDGVGHLDHRCWYDDLMRAADITAVEDTPVLRLPALALRLDEGRVADILRDYLAAGRTPAPGAGGQPVRAGRRFPGVTA